MRRHVKVDLRAAFEVVETSRQAQAAMMVLQPGRSTGDLENEHPNSEQWLYVISGTGTVQFSKGTIRLGRNSLVVIGKHELHKVTNTGRRPLVTLNFYVPPAYDRHGEPRVTPPG